MLKAFSIKSKKNFNQFFKILMVVMKQIFTKFILFFTLCLLSASLYGQRLYNVTVDGIAEPLLSVSSAFPSPCTEMLSGEMVAGLPANGCAALTNPEAVAGKIAVLDRGDCNFTDKVRNAQDAGALAVIVCNNRPESADGGGIFIMSGTDEDLVGLNTFAIMLSQESCAEFKANLPLAVDIEVTGFDLTADDKVLWGNETGQGDFDGGLNGWSAVTLECNGVPSEASTWIYEPDGVSEGGLGNGLSSGPSFCNGAMAFNSDFLDNGGNVETDANGQIISIDEGSGACPAPQIGELISPIIDISGSDVAGVSVEFFQSLRQFQSRFLIEYSIDGGENYVVAAEINTEVVANAVSEAPKQTIPLPGAAGSSKLRVKFTIFGNYYYWVVDDVKIIAREANNLRVNENFFATAPNVRVPRSQVDAIHFLADIQNIGAATQENTTLNMTVTNDATGEVVYNDDLAYGSITADSLAENKLFESTFTPDDVVANYTGIYTVSSDTGEDFDPSDNTRTINFSVTEDEFANEDGTNLGSFGIPAESISQTPTISVGNYFYLPNGSGWKVKNFGIGIANANEVGGLEVGIRMFKWTDIDADSDDSDFPEAAPNEREFIGFADYEILGNELGTDVNIIESADIFNQDGDESPILLEDDGHYLVMMTMDSEVRFSATPDLYNSYLAMNLATTQAGRPRYWSFFGNSSDIFETVYDANVSVTPLVRMYIEPEDASAVVELSADNLVTVGPNPAKEFVNINMEFTQSFDDVNVMITDAAGRVVLMNDLQNIKNHQMQVDVSNLMAGIFLVNINTPEGVRTEKFIKVD